MGAVRAVILVSLAVVLALANTNEEGVQAGGPAPEPPRLPQSPTRPSERLDLYEWMALMRELGHATDISEDEFFARLHAWDLAQESLDT